MKELIKIKFGMAFFGILFLIFLVTLIGQMIDVFNGKGLDLDTQAFLLFLWGCAIAYAYFNVLQDYRKGLKKLKSYENKKKLKLQKSLKEQTEELKLRNKALEESLEKAKVMQIEVNELNEKLKDEKVLLLKEPKINEGVE